MGKNLKGKNLGTGLSQRKDGRFSARFMDRTGMRQERYFKTLPEARRWLADAQYEDEHSQTITFDNMTTDEWFEYWQENIIADLAPNTRRNYRERYIQNIQPVLGKIPLTQLKPMHCKKVLINMQEEYAGSTIRQTYITMGTMLKSAKMNGLLDKHPMDGIKFTRAMRAKSDFKFFSREEQKQFLTVASDSQYYNQYALILETGLRTGELAGLTFDDVDYEHRLLRITKTIEYRYTVKEWRAGPPKTPHSYRTIPLTERALQILWDEWHRREDRYEAPMLSQKLAYIDRKSGEVKKFCMRDLVFIHQTTGEPIKNSAYDSQLYTLCDRAHVTKLGMHCLRHTYATRAIECGMQPKVLQHLLGHSSIQVTMDRYVHLTDSSIDLSIQMFEANQVTEYDRFLPGETGGSSMTQWAN